MCCQMRPHSHVQPQRKMTMSVGGSARPPPAISYLRSADTDGVPRSAVAPAAFPVSDLPENSASCLPVPAETNMTFKYEVGR